MIDLDSIIEGLEDTLGYMMEQDWVFRRQMLRHDNPGLSDDELKQYCRRDSFRMNNRVQDISMTLIQAYALRPSDNRTNSGQGYFY